MRRVYVFVTPEDFPLKAGSTYYINVSGARRPDALIRAIDNGSLVSTGIWLTEDKLDQFKRKIARYGAELIPCSYDEANHSGCQSSCILRGDDKCRW